MVNYKALIADILSNVLTDMEKDEIMSMIEVPTDEKMGDYAFPCFKLAKILRKAPPLIAKDVVESIRDNEIFEKVEMHM